MPCNIQKYNRAMFRMNIVSLLIIFFFFKDITLETRNIFMEKKRGDYNTIFLYIQLTLDTDKMINMHLKKVK